MCSSWKHVKSSGLEFYLLDALKYSFMAAKRFELVIDGVPYSFTATPFTFNTETRYKVGYDGAEHIFTWDSGLGRLASINDEAATLPIGLEEAIAERLQASQKIWCFGCTLSSVTGQKALSDDYPNFFKPPCSRACADDVRGMEKPAFIVSAFDCQHSGILPNDWSNQKQNPNSGAACYEILKKSTALLTLNLLRLLPESIHGHLKKLSIASKVWIEIY